MGILVIAGAAAVREIVEIAEIETDTVAQVDELAIGRDVGAPTNHARSGSEVLQVWSANDFDFLSATKKAKEK